MKRKKKERWIAVCLFLTLTVTLLAAPASAAGASVPPTPAESNNKGENEYSRWSKPICSYLYEDQGDLIRVEYLNGSILAERYNDSFELLDSRNISIDEGFPLWGGFYAGAEYNYVIIGQPNPGESDDVEVIRVIKYDKNWERLDQAGLFGANTVEPFDAGSLRCTEYNGMLYIRTSHTMYASDDGLHHQANLTFSVRESDMEVTDSYHIVMNNDYGYVSHSFNQFILVDQDANLVTLDHGDAYPRAAVLMRYAKKAGNSTFSGRVTSVEMFSFPGAIGANDTGASVGGLAETDIAYAAALNYGDSTSNIRDIYMKFLLKDDFSMQYTRLNRLTNYEEEGIYTGGTPMLASVGMDGGYILWSVRNSTGYAAEEDTICYAYYNNEGDVSALTTTQGALSDCQPILYNGKVTWYVTDNSAPVFYTLDEQGLSAAGAEIFLEDGEYMITSLNIVGSDGRPLNRIPSGGFYAEADIKKADGAEDAVMVLTVYSKNGQMLKSFYMRANSPDSAYSLGAYVDNADGEVGEIKAFLFPSLGSPTPLCPSVSVR